ncbi:DegT/DnrJ/EryC1/StrS family aminotransferase [Candidatus Bathyarchaeota archaeon]|nr:DegT/DnrJ/EryC1/StrS family aminotransferase [Candidatus Bathyarchaeota archaeon]MBS7612764.1 DegT/DnrJ/EryC1/StrS family aminotransferase [Candidatus Bathyarchaeota archaeon]MBS7618324.1 DegT/DnrJ/EryC1/StrS family aminotransferase [Candidatus Bathyarchaeota archaeon]
MAKLALKGGSREAENLRKIVPPWPIYDGEDERAVVEVVRSRRWCRLYAGSKAEVFEEMFAEYHQAKYGVAVANGTVALELALKTVGVGIGDEVIVPAVTFIATASAVSEVGAIPIFADIDPETAAISAKSIEENITDKTKAVIGVHYAGYPINFDEVLPLIKKYNLFLIEDCAHAHGSEWRGRKVGAIGHMGGFSLQESKSLTAGEGGIVLTNSDELAEKARLIHNIGRVLGKPGYMHYILSSNYRLSEIQAGLLISQMRRLKEQVELKHETGEYLASKLRKIGGVEPLKKDERITKRGYYYFVIRYRSEELQNVSREKFVAALNAEGVPAGVGYGMPLYRQPAFKRENLKGVFPEDWGIPKYENLSLPGAEEYCRREVTLPHQILLGGKESADLIVAAIEKIKENVDELLS